MSASPILMPKLGLTMEEGLLASWSVKPGDIVNPGDTLFVVETDKIANEVEARDSGTIVELLVSEGETVKVGAVLATWTGPADCSDNIAPEGLAQPVSESRPAVPPSSSRELSPSPAIKADMSARIVATPLARRLARQSGIDLYGVVGSGPRGRIKAIDVERHQAEPAPTRPSDDKEAVVAAGSRRPATQIEKTIARRLTEAKQTIPHFYVMADADITKLIKLRKELNDSGSTRISINHFILTAVAKALAQIPEMNALWDNGEIVTPASIDIGVAVDSSRGLLVPVLRDLGAAGLPAVAERANKLVERARDGQLNAADLTGGIISVSNVGMFGAGFLVPIINPGQSAILGVGAPKRLFKPDAEGKPELREDLGLVLSCDHRVHDGVRAARMLDHVVKALENPLRLLMS